jgi:hypothetical protein
MLPTRVMLIVDPHHWLAQDGSLPSTNLRLRRQVLRIARLIEYGGPLQVGASRETLVECKRRPRGQPCLGLMWVAKRDAPDFAIHAYCLVCGENEAMIYKWADTEWADGMMEPVPPDLGIRPS